jgi:bacterioferritin-associated ferredoxin
VVKQDRADPVIVCRCEDVTHEELMALLDQGVLSLEEIKRRTRCTMGPCQGRTCRHLLTQELARRLSVNPGDIAQPAFRTPVKPVKLGVLADAGLDSDKAGSYDKAQSEAKADLGNRK